MLVQDTGPFPRWKGPARCLPDRAKPGFGRPVPRRRTLATPFQKSLGRKPGDTPLKKPPAEAAGVTLERNGMTRFGRLTEW